MTDAGLKELARIEGLESLDLDETAVTDDGLKILAGMRLRRLTVPTEARTDVGLKHCLAALHSPLQLRLSGWQVTDKGLKEVLPLKRLERLDLECTGISDAGLKELRALNRLRSLDLRGTLVTDDGLKELAGMRLTELKIPGEAQTDVGLEHYLAALESPTHLVLKDWKVTDEGLKGLARIKQLRSLNLSYTQVTDAGVKRLLQALPGLKVIREDR